MPVEIRKLTEPFDYKQIAEIFRKTFFQEYLESGALLWNESYAKFYFECLLWKDTTRKFLLGAFIGEKLIGTLFGQRDSIIFDNEMRLELLNLGFTAVDPEHRRQGVAKALLSTMIDEARKNNIDFIMAFPEKDRYGANLLEEHGEFTSYGKTKHLIKLMEKRGLHVLREYKKMNPVVVKIASMFSHLPDLGEPEGDLRTGQAKDFPGAVEMLNSYRSRVPMAHMYFNDIYSGFHERQSTLNSRFGDPWGFHWMVLEREGKILANINYRIEIVSFQPQDEIVGTPTALFTNLGFHEDLELEQKTQFLSALLRKIHATYPDIFVAQITCPQHEMRAFKKLKFNDDQSSYTLYMRLLTKNGEELNRYRRYKEYLLQYYR